MPHTSCTIRRWELELVVTDDDDVDSAMRRADRQEIDAVCRHLLGDLTPATPPGSTDRGTHR